MSLQALPSAERLHIGFFGRRNAGKSSVVNAVTGQSLAIVSDVLGTTTDPVSKAMELLPLGPVVIIDTPGIDDEGELGSLRVQKSYGVLHKTDIAVLVVDAGEGLREEDRRLIETFQKKTIPYLIVYNKIDRSPFQPSGEREIAVSAQTREGVEELKNRLAALCWEEKREKTIVSHLLSPGEMVVLVVPIDGSAPKGRLILPQQQTIRDLLDHHCLVTVVQDTELPEALQALKDPPRLVITDSQAFARVSRDTPEDIPLTSFSILFANYKGNLQQAVEGVTAIGRLKDGDRVLISEGCTHHRQCGDIGTVKLPALLHRFTGGKELSLSWSSGTEFPEDLSEYRLVIHCGGCMLNEKEMQYRLRCAREQNVPMTNYGTAIAYMNGILRRSLSIFPELAAKLPES